MDSKESKSRSWTRRSRGPQVPGTQFAKNASTDGASEQSGPSLSRTVSSLKAEINSPSKLSSVRNLRRSVTALHAHNKPGKGLTPVTSFARPDAPFAQDFADSRANRDDEVVQEIPSPSHRGQLSPALENASQTQSLHLDHMSWTELPPRVNIFLLDLGCRLREVSIVGSHLKELPEVGGLFALPPYRTPTLSCLPNALPQRTGPTLEIRE